MGSGHCHHGRGTATAVGDIQRSLALCAPTPGPGPRPRRARAAPRDPLPPTGARLCLGQTRLPCPAVVRPAHEMRDSSVSRTLRLRRSSPCMSEKSSGHTQRLCNMPVGSDAPTKARTKPRSMEMVLSPTPSSWNNRGSTLALALSHAERCRATALVTAFAYCLQRSRGKRPLRFPVTTKSG